MGSEFKMLLINWSNGPTISLKTSAKELFKKEKPCAEIQSGKNLVRQQYRKGSRIYCAPKLNMDQFYDVAK